MLFRDEHSLCCEGQQASASAGAVHKGSASKHGIDGRKSIADEHIHLYCRLTERQKIESTPCYGNLGPSMMNFPLN